MSHDSSYKEISAPKIDVVEDEATCCAEGDECTAFDPPNGKIAFENDMAREEAVSYLDAIVKGLATGSVTFRQGDECLELQPAANVEVEVKASRKGRKEKVSFELSWRRPAENELVID